MNEFQAAKEKCEQFLKTAYDLGKDQPMRMVSLNDVAQASNMDGTDLNAENELINIASYLEDRGFAEGQADGSQQIEVNFQVGKSKPIANKIDCVLAEHYGFTNEELDFIINYDIKYRMGSEQS